MTTKHYSIDPSDSAFNCMGSVYSMRQSSGDGRHGGGSSSSCNHRPGQMSSAGHSSTGLRHQTSSPTQNGTYPEGNRSGNIIYSVSSDDAKMVLNFISAQLRVFCFICSSRLALRENLSTVHIVIMSPGNMPGL